MNWFEKIKSMNEKELAEFLADFVAGDIANDYCGNACSERNEYGGCSHKRECPISDCFIIEQWLKTKVSEN